MRRHLMSLATLVLVGACVGPGVASPKPLPTATQFATHGNTSTARTPPTLSPEEICAEVEVLKEVISLGECAGVITVGVRSSAQALARNLREKYGDAIEISVGLFPYPPPDDPQRACLDIRPIVLEHSPLVAAVEVDRTIVAGAHYEGEVRLTNAGPVSLEFDTSSNFSLFLFRPGDPDPIGMSELGSMGTGYGADLAPGESVRLPAVGGTASCDLGLGYVVPAGIYEARALVDFEMDPEEEAVFFWSDPATVEVVNP